MKALLLRSVAVLLALMCAACGKEPAAAQYATKVNFREGKGIVFPDFTLTYKGKRHVVPSQYPRGWWIHDFSVSAGKTEKTVSWSSGTGDIGPTEFEIGGKKFWLELSHADKLGRLRDDELVVSRAR